jgi:hypothetical protein
MPSSDQIQFWETFIVDESPQRPTLSGIYAKPLIINIYAGEPCRVPSTPSEFPRVGAAGEGAPYGLICTLNH